MNNKNQESLKTTYSGVVLWFSNILGYGFIETSELKKPDGSCSTIFAHFSRIVSGEQYKTLSAKQLVHFEIVESEKGLMAVNIKEDKIIKAKSEIIS